MDPEEQTQPMTENRTEVVLRPGRPSIQEGLACAHFLDTASEGFFKILLGSRASGILAQAYVKPGNEYSYENTLFASVGGHQVGMAIGFTAAERRQFPKNPLAQCEGYPRVRAGILGFLFSPMLRILDSVADEDFYLLSLAVDPEQRGRGVGSTLVQAMEERARAAASRRLSLDVAAKNKGAQRLYGRHGLKTYAKWPKHINIGSLSLYRMAKPL
jgi:ribosomal protein S18 acetylase RimI-like enzyme